MPQSAVLFSESMILLSQLLLLPADGDGPSRGAQGDPVAHVSVMSRDDFDAFVALAHANHVIVRGLQIFSSIVRECGDDVRAEWAETALAAERLRIQNAMAFLHEICGAFEQSGYDATVIKSLDHWPDIGSDLDLYTNTDPRQVVPFMKERFQAKVAPRSLGDRLACKWNFVIPGLPEPIEIHMQRLGQTGEQVTLASAVPMRAQMVQRGEFTFPVPANSDRLMISTLQRMYRHFYFRLCDIVDSAALVDAGAVDFGDLRQSGSAAGIWEGVATYLKIVADYVQQYRGSGLDLPQFVTASARFGGEQVYFARDFLRIPILPQSVSLYKSQLAGLLRKMELHSSARLGLLPWLATAAAVGQKITGSDKGIW